MAVPRFANMLEVAVYVLQHHRLSDLLSNHQLDAFIEFLYRESDGEMDLPSIVLEFFRAQIAQLDKSEDE